LLLLLDVHVCVFTKRTWNIVALLSVDLVKLMIARMSNYFFKTIIVELNMAMKAIPDILYKCSPKSK
ncbi:unnamed protein product, partial [Prunus brigantina]